MCTAKCYIGALQSSYLKTNLRPQFCCHFCHVVVVKCGSPKTSMHNWCCCTKKAGQCTIIKSFSYLQRQAWIPHQVEMLGKIRLVFKDMSGTCVRNSTPAYGIASLKK